MKRFLLVFGLVGLLTSCSFNRTEGGGLTTTNEHGLPCLRHLELMDVEFNGEKHEYVYFHCASGRSLSHWEGCKYCKEHKNDNK